MQICSVEDCFSKAKAKGLCIGHYNRLLNYGDLNLQRKKRESVLIIEEDHAKIVLQRDDLFALIDLEDVIKVKGYVWYVTGEGYAYNQKLKLLLHQYIIGKAPENMETDHINRNKLDCRKKNLRHISRSDNKLNSTRHDESIGIRRKVNKNFKPRWQAYISVNGKHVHVGTYFSEEEAKAARATALAKRS